MIEELGCTEEEYRQFTETVRWLSRERPAEYSHIPDVQNYIPFVTEWALIALYLGTVALQFALTPKPNVPQQREITNRNLDSIAGRDRFAPTYGFQASQELSRYGETVPIVFTEQKRVQLNVGGVVDWYYVGGIMISPKLVWSRMFSWGGYQSLHAVFLAAQSPMARGPYSTAAEIASDRAGIYIGQTPLDAFPESDYRWYYYQGGVPVTDSLAYRAQAEASRTSSDSRLLGRNNRYGTFWVPEGADVNAFQAQTFAGLTGEAFCHTFSPSSKTQFGVYNGLPNGTPYRLNFEVVSIPDSTGESSKKTGTAKRFQIAGNPFLAGTGRNYARQFGIVAHNNIEYPAPTQNNGTRIVVNVNDTIKIIYNTNKVQEKLFYKTNHPNLSDRITSQATYLFPNEDAVDNKQIATSIDTEHEQQDELLKLGTKWLIGNCLFEVVQRSPEDQVFDKTDTQEYNVIMKCIAVYGDGGPGYVGVCDRGFLTSTTSLPEGDNGPLYDIGQAWFPICKAEIASVQNSRRCEATEIGLKSNVWTRFNGICNFNSVPSVEKLNAFDYQDVSLTAGVNQSYARRASFFHLYVRPANNDFQPEEGWEKLNPYPFCVVGSSPQDQFNFIRIGHPYEQWEFRLRPLTSGEIVQIIGKFNEATFGTTTIKGPCIRLNVEGVTTPDPKQFYRNPDSRTRYGVFTLSARGFIDSMADLSVHSEMVSDPVFSGAAGLASLPPTSVRFVKAIVRNTGADATAREISNGISRAINKDPDPTVEPAPLVNVPYYQLPINSEYLFDSSDKAAFQFSASGRTVRLNLRLRVSNLGPISATATRAIFWSIINGENISAEFTGSWTPGTQFTITSVLLDDRPEARRFIDYIFQVNAPNQVRLPAGITGSRIFEANSAIAEVSHYNTLISRSCDNGPEHEITYINENLANDPARNGVASYTGCAMAGIKIRGGFNLSSFEQLHLYQRTGIQVTRLRQAGNGDTIMSAGPSNIFTDLAYFLMTNYQTGTGEIFSTELIDVPQLARTGSFLEASALYYDDVIVEAQNLREFLSRISASLLCALVMRGGKFSIEPVLPIDSRRNYTMFDVPVPISGIFTEGNIIEGSFQLEYVPAQERSPIRAAVRYRTEFPNRFPQEQTTVVYYNDQANGPLENFDFTHITSRYHAELFAKFALSTRRHRNHSVTFKTLPYGLALAPGDFIRVVTQSGYSTPAATGIIKADGAIVSPATFTNGQVVSVYYWDKTDNEVTKGQFTVTIKNDLPFASALFDTIFSIDNTSTQALVYMVDSIQLDEEGLVEISASHFPVDSNNYSVIANELKPDYNGFTTVADLSPD